MTALAAQILAALDRAEETARAATDGGFGWRVADLPGANEVWADRDAAGYDAFMVASTATRLNPNPGVKGHNDAAHIAANDPAHVLRLTTALRKVVELAEREAERAEDLRDDHSADVSRALLVALASVWDEPGDNT